MDLLLLIPVLIAAGIIAWRDYKYQIVQKQYILLLGVCGIPLALTNWVELFGQPEMLTSLIPATLFIVLIIIAPCITFDGMQLLALGGADILTLVTLISIFPGAVIYIALAALILGVILSSAYLYGKNKHTDAPLVQKLSMISNTTTYNGKPATSWQSWTMPLCVPILLSLITLAYLGIL